tara:strand:+ start:89 stop:451 length:363 start_codon:yes stop_codon:yes gene_type:complete
MNKTQKEIVAVCDEIKNLLISKNQKYGNSALEPVRVFSRAEPTEQLCVRIDDKLSRISKGAGLLATDEDVINDLIGYLVLLKIAQRKENAISWEEGPAPALAYASHQRKNFDPTYDGPDT